MLALVGLLFSMYLLAVQLFVDADRDDIVAEAEGAQAAGEAAGIRGTPTLMIRSGDADPYVIQVANVDDLRAALDDALDA